MIFDKIFLIRNLITILALLSLISIRSSASENYSKQVPNRSEVIKVFKKAIDLNEDFKSKLHKIPLDKYNEIRKELEEYHEDMLFPKLADCVNILSSGRDSDLAVELFRLLISFKNSADEQLSFSFGEVFINNPDLIVDTFDKFEKSEQYFLYRKLLWGWMNVIFSKDIPDERILDSIKKLKDLKSQM